MGLVQTEQERTVCLEPSALYLRVNEHSLYAVNLMKLGFNLFESCSEIVLHLKCRELLVIVFYIVVLLALLATLDSLSSFLRLAFSSN